MKKDGKKKKTKSFSFEVLCAFRCKFPTGTAPAEAVQFEKRPTHATADVDAHRVGANVVFGSKDRADGGSFAQVHVGHGGEKAHHDATAL